MKNGATITVLVFIILLCILLPSTLAVREIIDCEDAEILSASIYTIPADEQDVDYGNWLNILTKDSDCNPQKCWGVGINDPANVTGNEIYQEFLFHIPQTRISEFVFNFSSCWGGGQNGCGHDDHPEYTQDDPGKAQVEVYNGSSWVAVGSQINIGDITGSSAMELTEYSRKTNFTSSFLDSNNQTKVRIKTTGTFFGTSYDAEMYTDYAGLSVCYVSDRQYDLNFTVEDDEEINTTVELIKGNQKVYNQKSKKHKITASEGSYDVKITPSGNVIDHLLIKDFEAQDSSVKIKLKNPILNNREKAYSIQTEMNSSMVITVTATGDHLYKCTDWNFDSETCEGEWTPVFDITRGETYNITLSKKGCFKERKNYDLNEIDAKGISKLKVYVANNAMDEKDHFTGKKKIEFKDGNNTLFYFTYDFDESDINLSTIKVIKTSTAFVVNLANQEADGTKKTIYFPDKKYVKLCVKNDEINSASEISASCTGENEIKFDACIGDKNGITISGITCYDEGDQFRIENLAYSGIRGTLKTQPKTTTSSGGGGGSKGYLTNWNSQQEEQDTVAEEPPAQTASSYENPPNEIIQAVEPIEIVTGNPVVEENMLEPEEPRVTTSTVKIKKSYPILSVFAVLISMVVVFFVLRRENTPPE